MPTADLSISPPTFVQIDWHGWPPDAKTALEGAIRTLPGVNQVSRAGGGSSIHVHYDPARTNQPDVVVEVDRLADEILPGHNFSGR